MRRRGKRDQMSDVKILLAASLKMRAEGRTGEWKRGTSEEGRGGSRVVEGNGELEELFQCPTISLGCRAEGGSREVVQVCGLGAREDRGGFPSGGGRHEQGHLRAFRAMGFSFSDPRIITRVSGVATSAADGAACTTATATFTRASG